MQNFCDSSLALASYSLPLPLPLSSSLYLSRTRISAFHNCYTHLFNMLCLKFCAVGAFPTVGFSHAPKSLQHFCVHTTFARLEYFYLTRIYCEATVQRVPLPPPSSFYYLPQHCPTLLVISHAFYTHAACFKCLKMCVCFAVPRPALFS